jgi:predicted O-methyltransferase YrrM
VRAEAAEQICRYLTKGPTALPPIADIVTETPPLPRPDLPIALGISPGGHLSAATASSHRSYVRISEDLANPHPFVATVRQAFSTAVTDAAILAGGIAEIPGMTGWRSRNFLYALLTGMDDPRYLEIGLWAGGSFAAAASVGKLRGVGIDDWSWGPGTADICKSNFASFRHKDADIRIIDADYRNVAYEQLGSFNVYFYDGPTDPGDHSDALSRPLPVLDDCFVFIANNWNWRHVRDSARTAISDNDLDVVLAIEIRSTIDDSHPAWSGSASEWHNGFFVSILRKRTTA